MKVVILAAGKGTRLGDSNRPKTLTRLANGKSILGMMVDNLRHQVPDESVIVVVGYLKEMISEAFPDLTACINPDFDKENTSKSLYKAIKNLHEDVLWINGDVVFHPSILDKVLSVQKTGMVVNVGRVGDEEVKYRSDVNGRILEVSKTVKDPQGEALGINYVTAADLEILKRTLKACEDRDYFERGIELAIQEGINVAAIPVDNELCVEIDFSEDLEKANRMIGSWTF